MIWLIGLGLVGGVLVIGAIARQAGRFSYRGRRYRRHGDGSFTYVGGETIDDPKERADVETHWNDSRAASFDSGDEGGGDGDGGGD